MAGDPFDPELAAAAAATTEASALKALDELLQLDLVRETDVPRRFRFRHPLVRRAVYESTPGGWRLGAHERSAEALTARGALAAERAHHVERSARQGDAAAVAIVREAGDAAAHARARERRALVRSRATAPARGRAGRGAGRAPPRPARERSPPPASSPRATPPCWRASSSSPRDSVALQVRLTTACAGVEHLLGHHEQAHARLASAMDGLPRSRLAGGGRRS